MPLLTNTMVERFPAPGSEFVDRSRRTIDDRLAVRPVITEGQLWPRGSKTLTK